jgi:ectoine hydroxylase
MKQLSKDQFDTFREDGFILLKALFDTEEIEMLRTTAHADRELDNHSFSRADGEGGKVRLSLWNHPGDNLYGMFARSNRMVTRAEELLGEEVYHYHSKMILKDPKVGGAWTWHQDYGYWYQNGLLYPDLVSVFIAVDKATRENGCLQVIRGSHKMGRIDHILTGDQAGADMERVNACLERLELVYCEMEPGDAIFFHSNLLHRSDQNRSEHPRWSMVCCYNTRSNDPYKASHHPGYTPLKKVDDAMIKQTGVKTFEAEGQAWLDPEKDESASGLDQG